MKTIYELCFRTENGFNGNLLFSNHKKAKDYLSKFYSVGMPYTNNSLIVSSLIVKRTLF